MVNAHEQEYEIFEITAEASQQRLDKWLATVFAHLSRSHLTEHIKAGHVIVNEKSALPSLKLKAGDVVKVASDALEEGTHDTSLVPQEGELEIVVQHKHYLILNKPAGLVVHPGAGVPDGTLANFLIARFPDNAQLPNWGLIHRLDKDTSGLLLVALTAEGYHVLTQLMLERAIKRNYLALVMGNIRYSQTINTLMARDPHNRLKRAVTHSPLAKQAITHIKPLERFEKMTLIECTLETGRTHQIRVHLEHIRHPLVGEPLYCGHMPTKKLFPRQALHATRLGFFSPWEEREVVAESPLPEDLQQFIENLPSL